MGSTTNTLGGAAIILAQAFPAAAGTFPVTAECAKEVLEGIYNPAHFEEQGILVKGGVSEPVKDQVVVSEHRYSPLGEVRGWTSAATVTMDAQGFVSSIETKENYEMLSGEVVISGARIEYSRLTSEFTVSSTDHVLPPYFSMVETISTGFAKNIERGLMQCGSDLISSNSSRSSKFGLG